MRFLTLAALAILTAAQTPERAGATLQVPCDEACMFDLTKAFAAFGMEKAAREFDAHDPSRTVLDTWAQDRAPSAQRSRSTAALRAIGRGLGIAVASRRQHPAWMRCVEDLASPGCRAEHGRTFIALMSLRIPEPGWAVARVSITILAGERRHITSSDVLMRLVDGEWRFVAEDVFLVGSSFDGSLCA